MMSSLAKRRSSPSSVGSVPPYLRLNRKSVESVQVTWTSWSSVGSTDTEGSFEL